jgi:hypothetical protein
VIKTFVIALSACLLTVCVIAQQGSLASEDGSDFPFEYNKAHYFLYQGNEYHEYMFSFEGGGHPYFDSSGFRSGSANYYGLDFKSIPLKYDLVQDVLVLRHYTGYSMKLHPSRLASFRIGTASFIHLRDSTTAGAPAAGYYQVLHDDVVKVFAKKAKNIQEDVYENSIHRTVFAKNRYYIFSAGQYHQVTNSKSLLNVFGDKRQQVRQHLSSSKIKYRRNPELAIIAAAKEYSRLSK